MTNTHRTILQQNKLLHTDPTLLGLTESFRHKPKGSLFFGFGLTSSKEPTIGLPFDSLIFILSAEFLRQKFSLGEIHCLIADTHALSNVFCEPIHISNMALRYKRILENISLVTGIKLFIHTASSFDQSIEYQELLHSINTSKGLYVHKELTDILWFHRFYDVKLKLGWLIHVNEKKAGRDERYFDNEFTKLCTSDISFAYTQAGRTFDKNRPYVSPYVSISNENRILIDDTIDVRSLHTHFGFSKSKLMHLQSIVNMWDIFTGNRTSTRMELPDRIQNIIDIILSIRT